MTTIKGGVTYLYIPDNYDIYEYHERELERYKRLYRKQKYEEENIEESEVYFYYVKTEGDEEK